MRKLILFIAFLACVGSLFAADPTLGTWKLNLAKSKFPSSVTPSKEETVVVKDLGNGRFEMALSGVQANGDAVSMKLTHPQNGGLIEGLPATTTGILTVLSPGDVVTTFIQAGKQVRVHRNIVSKDGKRMTQTLKYRDDKGQPVEILEIWDRQ
jgi:hypothetical protein